MEWIWMELFKGLLSSFIGTFGFSLLFRVRRDCLASSAIGGTLAYGVYWMCEAMGMGLFISNFLAAVIAAFYAEVFARVKKSPAVIFLITAIVPLVPGSFLYYTMSSLFTGQYDSFWFFLKQTLVIALGIASGMIVISILTRPIFRLLQKHGKRNRSDNG